MLRSLKVVVGKTERLIGDLINIQVQMIKCPVILYRISIKKSTSRIQNSYKIQDSKLRNDK